MENYSNNLNKSQKREIINDLDFLTALSNRQLSVNYFDTLVTYDYKLMWSIDRITLVGFVNDNIRLLDKNGEFYTFSFENLMYYLTEINLVKDTGMGFRLVDEHSENIAYVEKVKFDDTKVRIDFNPNKLKLHIKGSLKDFIKMIMIDPHFSRADVAVDIFNLPDNMVNQYQLVESVSKRLFFGRGGALETMYWGSSSSERQIRLYNKYVEQKHKRKIIPKDIKTWWRLEVQLRAGKTNDWVCHLEKTLEKFVSLAYIPENLSASDKLMMIAISEHPEIAKDLSRPTRYKYRDLLLGVRENDGLTNALISSFKEYQDQLNADLVDWLNIIDVTGTE